ncbi:MAG: BrnT family toxin [Pseudomonadota bacterium]
MKFDWDPEKSKANWKKHGVRFEDAQRIFHGPVVEVADNRFDYEEARANSLGLLDGVVILNVTHTDRDGTVRIISARHATKAERRFYEKMVF